MNGNEDVPDTTAELLNHPRYRKVKDVNRGAFGVVVLAEDRHTGEEVAIKFIKRGSKVTKYVLREILNHRSLVHPHIVQFKEVFLTKRCLATAMEYCDGGDMLEYVVKRGGLPETSSRWFFQQLISAVDYLHKMGFASRDIKLDNVLLDSSRRPLLKLCDFGYSKHERYHSAPGSTVGTPAYLAPEVIRATQDATYDAKLADIWSCGVFLYAATIGTYPFYRPQDRGNPREVQLMIQRILRMEYSIPHNGKVSPQLRDLLSKMLVDDPGQRISMVGIMHHPWYLTDLPEGVIDMNDELPLPGDDAQNLKDVERIIALAQKPLRTELRRAKDDADDTADDVSAPSPRASAFQPISLGNKAADPAQSNAPFKLFPGLANGGGRGQPPPLPQLQSRGTADSDMPMLTEGSGDSMDQHGRPATALLNCWSCGKV